MKTIISKRYALNIPIIYLFIIPFFICLLFGYLLFFLVFGEYNKENSINENNHFLFLLPSFIFLGCLVPIYIYWKNAPSIAINNQIIKIRNKTFFLNDIKEISLSGKNCLRSIIDYPMQGFIIYFKDGKKRVLFDDMYANVSEIKSFLEQVVVNHREYKPIIIKEIDFKTIAINNEVVHKGSFTRFFNLGLFLSLIFSIIPILAGSYFPFFIVLFICILIYSLSMYYFSITDEYLIIKNHILYWKKRVFRLIDIREIIFEVITGKQSAYMIVVITNDFKYYRFKANALKVNTWFELKKTLEDKGIKVRNEAFFDINERKYE
jgi:hypothetical protein